MATPVELPQLGNTVEECLITRWVKRKGDAVAAGDIVAEIETDKTTFEIAAPVAGVMLETFFDEGDLVKVFTNICVIGTAGESPAAFDPRSAGDRQAAIGDRQSVVRDPQSAVRDPQSAVCDPQSAVRDPQSAVVDRRSAVGDPPSAIGSPQSAPANVAAPYSPRARRFAAQHGFQPASIDGSGPGGRVLESDVRRAYELAKRSPAPSTLRTTIARRMRESLASTAQYTLHASAGAAGLLAQRARMKASSRTADITINDLVAFCTIQALLAMPELNAEYVDGRIVTHSEVHLGFAVDTPRGLLAPVIRNAHTLSIGDLARRAKVLTAQAVEGTIAPDDLSGGTFTISNLGGLGIEMFTPVINTPQVAILGVGAIELKPVRVGGKVEFVDSIGLSLTCDHQAIDGAPGARFLNALREKIESVESLTVTE